jgi:hypothetical protein
MCRRHRLRHGRRNNAAGATPYRESLVARALTRLRLPAGRPPVGGADRKGIMLPALAVLAIVFALSF